MSKEENIEFNGYIRSNGTVGVRNHLLVLPLVKCVNYITNKIISNLRMGVTLETAYGCCQIGTDAAQTFRTILGFAVNPNVGACLVVGCNCADIDGNDLVKSALAKGVRVSFLNIDDFNNEELAILAGIEICSQMLSDMMKIERRPVPVKYLQLGLECGGSDAWSGFSANPTTGECSDLLISHGGTAILSETQEMIGAEQLFATRAIDSHVRDTFIEIVKMREQESIDGGVDIASVNPSPGNKTGGLSTLEEKSLGCMQKGGRMAKLMEVVDYAQKPIKRGLIFMDTPGDDVESITGMVAGGCQLVVFTTGRGTCVGNPIAPVIKVASNTPMYNKMRNNIDFNAGLINEGKENIKQCGTSLFKKMVSVASGELTKSELLECCCNFSITRTGLTL